MVISNRVRAVFLYCVGVLLFAGYGEPPVVRSLAVLPEVTMTSGGGFASSAQRWRIAPDGAWTWERNDKAFQAGDLPSRQSRSGRLTVPQRRELAVLLADPLLRRELGRPHAHCDRSDGSAERLDVGRIRYVSSWCPEYRPGILRVRARIMSLTTAS